MVDSRSAILAIRRAFPTMRARPLKVKAPRRPNFKAAAARRGAMFLLRLRPLSKVLGDLRATPESRKVKILCKCYDFYQQINDFFLQKHQDLTTSLSLDLHNYASSQSDH